MIKGYEQYKEQSINTMTKSEMLNLLFDEILKRLKRAKLCLVEEKYDIFEIELDRSRDIISYLNNCLDRKYPVSANLAQLYEYFNFNLARAKSGRREEPIDEVLPFVLELRDSFREADIMCKKTNVQHDRKSLIL